jgi:hypothetical protein
LIVFLVHTAVGFMLAATPLLRNLVAERWWAMRPSLVRFALVAAANLLAVIAEAGRPWKLPFDPQRYFLFG